MPRDAVSRTANVEGTARHYWDKQATTRNVESENMHIQNFWAKLIILSRIFESKYIYSDSNIHVNDYLFNLNIIYAYIFGLKNARQNIFRKTSG